MVEDILSDIMPALSIGSLGGGKDMSEGSRMSDTTRTLALLVTLLICLGSMAISALIPFTAIPLAIMSVIAGVIYLRRAQFVIGIILLLDALALVFIVGFALLLMPMRPG